jgi:Ca2+-binding RTX toxin-like protein
MTFPATLALSTLGPAGGSTLTPDPARDERIAGVVAVGDVNGDGISDFAIQVEPGAAGLQTAVYVVFGGQDGLPANLNLASLNGMNGFRVLAPESFRVATVAAAGDLNGDGRADLVIGAPGVDTSVSDAGAGFIIYGRQGGFGATVDLSGAGAGVSRLTGATGAERIGEFVAGGHDLNGDGRGDLIVGGRSSAYVLFGAAFPPSDLSVASLNGQNGVRLGGLPSGDRLVVSVGDMSGDGVGDFAIAVGEDVFVIHGGSGLNLSVFDVSSLNGTNGYRVQVNAAVSSLAAAGDLNGDGRADLLLGARDSGGDNGLVAALFGAPVRAASAPLLQHLGAAGSGFTVGALLADEGLGASVGAVDLNNDGLLDVVAGNRHGDAYVLFGQAGGWPSFLNVGTYAGARMTIDATGGGAPSLASIGDVNGDAIDDLGYGLEGPGDGVVHILYGRPGSSPRFVRDGAGADATSGGTANDILFGGGGNDRLYGIDGHDLLHGEAGADRLRGGAGDDTLEGGTGNDTLGGDAGADRVAGGEGDDQLSGDDGVDRLLGEGGGDTLLGGADDDTLLGGEGEDSLDGGLGGDALDGGADLDTLRGGAGDDVVQGGGDRDQLEGEGGDDLLVGGAGLDLLTGGEGDDTVQGGADNDYADGGAGRDLLGGDDGSDTLIGGDGGDTLLGGDGDDSLDGRVGADLMDGGEGADSYAVDDSGDRIRDEGGSGRDIAYIMASEVDLALWTGVETIIGQNAAGQVFRGSSGADDINGASGADLIEGGGGADTLDGGLGQNTVRGGDGADFLRGSGLLDGGAGADRMDGWIDDTTYVVDNRLDLILDGGGYDEVLAYVDFHTPTGVEVLRLMGDARVASGNSSDNRLIGTAFDDTLSGLSGLDTLEGGAGQDTLQGGEGDDTLSGGDGFDVVDFQSEVSGLTVSLAFADAQAVGRPGLGADTITGVEGVIGGAAGDSLTGSDSDDRLWGRGGADTLAGGLGTDTLEGGLGDDVLIVDASDVLLDDGGFDEVRTAAATYRLPDGFERLTGLSNTGQILFGGAGGDTVTGGGGDDRLFGGDGADVLHDFSGNNRVFGEGGDDNLATGAGDDIVNGGAGADRLRSGDGSDRFYVDNSGDDARDTGGAGVDVVFSSVSFTLHATIEDLRLTGAAQEGRGTASANRIWGNESNNRLSGFDGADTLFGEGGADTLSGGAGLDRLYGGAGADVFVFDQAPGGRSTADRVFDFADGDLIHLGVDVFTALSEGVLSTAAFHVGRFAQTPEHRILYDPKNGLLAYDADGAGGAAAVVFAQLSSGLSLDAGDFLVV